LSRNKKFPLEIFDAAKAAAPKEWPFRLQKTPGKPARGTEKPPARRQESLP